MDGTVLGGRYTLGRVLGRGGFGVVYEGADAKTGRTVAIKVLSAVEPEQGERFRREVAALAALRHPHIVRVLDVGEGAPGQVYLVMELLKGQTLHALYKDGPLAPERAVRLVLQLLSALEKAHSIALIHRDLKPGNLFVSGSGASETLKVLDFGLARAVDAPSLTKTGEILGTPAYMAPEQARAQRVDERTDIYAVGACLYAALAARAPIQGASPVQQIVRAMAAGATPLEEVAPAVPPALVAIVARAMQGDPADRFPSAGDMRRALEAWLVTSSKGRFAEVVRVLLGSALVVALGAGGYLGVSRLSRRVPEHIASAAPVVVATGAGSEETTPLVTSSTPLAPPHTTAAPTTNAAAPRFKPCSRDAECGPLERCYPGGCSCTGAAIRCGQTCRVPGSASNDCGCGEACRRDEHCVVNGTHTSCRPCDHGTSACGDDRCVDKERDKRHCGACNHACGENQHCAGGKCVETVGYGGRCTSNARCAYPLSCEEGTCSCRFGWYFCDGDCVTRPCRDN